MILNLITNEKTNYSTLIQECLSEEKSNLPDWILEMDGMSGKKYRHFINNLIDKIENPRYLEVGCWKGSTTCSAIYGNDVTAYCIDNWSEFGGPKDIFCKNIERCVDDGENIGITFEESDFRDMNYMEIGKYNLYLFDGPHKMQDQYDGLYFVQQALDDEFIFICDDWNWKDVRDGTFQAISDLKLNVIYSKEIRTTDDDSYPSEENTKQNSDWHNGYYISVLSKNELN